MRTLALVLFAVGICGLSQLEFHSGLDPKSYLSPHEAGEVASQLEEALPTALLIAKGVQPSQLPVIRDRLKQLPRVQSVWTSLQFPGNREGLFHLSPDEEILVLELKKGRTETLSEVRRFNHELRSGMNLLEREFQIELSLVGKLRTRELLHDRLPQEALFPVSFIALFVFLTPLFLYRRILYLLAPSALGVFVLTFTFGLYGFFGEHFSYFSLTLIPLLLCLCLLDCVFLLNRYHQTGDIVRGREELFYPCLLTSMTTLLGFATLAGITHTPILREYSIFACLGMVSAFIGTFYLLPAFLPSGRETCLEVNGRLQFIDRLAKKILLGGLWHQRIIRRSALVFSLFLLPGVFLIRTGSTQIFPKSHPYQKQIDRLESHLGTLLPIRFTVSGKGGAPPQATRLLLYAYSLERWLHGEKLIRQSLSPFQVFTLESFKHRADSNTRPDWRVLAAKSGGYLKTNERGELVSLSFLAWPKSSALGHLSRMRELLHHYERTMMAEFQAEVHGPFLVAKSIEHRFLKEAALSFFVVVAVVLLVMACVLRDLRVWLIFSAVNLGPILWICGMMGYVGVPFHMGLLGLPCILFGVIVDNSIHFCWRFRETGSLESTGGVLGRPMLISTALLVVGMGAQIFSGYGANVDFGWVGALGLVVALFFDMCVLPGLLAGTWEHTGVIRKFRLPRRKSLPLSP